MKICWFTTGRDREAFTLFHDVLSALEAGAIEGSISLVFMNREAGESAPSDEIIEYAAKKQIPTVLFSSKRFLTEKGLTLGAGRSLFDAEVKRLIETFEFDLIFLAGYMLILSSVLHDSYPVLNLHPSLPGAYKGKWEDVIRETIRDGQREFGAMIHLVEAVLDEGAPVAYARLRLAGEHVDALYERASQGDVPAQDELFRIMRDKEFAIEMPLIIQTLSAVSHGIISVAGKKVYQRGAPVQGGIDVSEEVTGWLQRST